MSNCTLVFLFFSMLFVSFSVDYMNHIACRDKGEIRLMTGAKITCEIAQEALKQED